MRPFKTKIFVLVLALSFSSLGKEKGANLKTTSKTKGIKLATEKNQMKYGDGFGESNTKVDEIFNFKDFDLKFEGLQDLSENEIKQKKESIAAGIDGGSSMLSPSNLFTISKGDIKKKITLSVLPYAKFEFEIDGNKFELKNANTLAKKWILEKVKIENK